MSPYTELIDEMLKQSQYIDSQPIVFRCDSCRNYKGSLSCEKNIFIVFEGANLNHCGFYVEGKKCRHCGRIT